MGLGWFLGTYRGERTVGHAGADPGFGSRLVLVPERRTGVVVLANSNTAPTGAVARAVLDLVLDLPPARGRPRRAPATDHRAAGAGARRVRRRGRRRRLPAGSTSTLPARVDLDDDRFVDAVWGAIELHRPDLVRPLLDVWTTVRPDSSQAWAMTGWAHLVDGDTGRAAELLRGRSTSTPGTTDAAALLRGLVG